MMKVIRYPAKESWKDLLRRPELDRSSLYDSVQEIIDEVAAKGDSALKYYTAMFDGVTIENIAVGMEEIREAGSAIDADLQEAVRVAFENIAEFHRSQVMENPVIETSSGVKCWQKQVPIEKVGIYIPGGSSPLISTVLMLGIPASLAGCKEIILCTPPDKEGQVHPAILYVAGLLNVNGIFKVGGAQAVAAMAYGTETVPQVYKIFGPGNQYVTAAKTLVSRDKVAIDIPAGPSEVAVIADQSAIPEFVASDLLSQAEHGADSQVLMFTSEEGVIGRVLQELEEQIGKIPRKEIARKSLENSKIFLLKNPEEILEMINMYAPEHLIIASKDFKSLENRIVNAGSVFLGNFTPESAGDYASGTNHTLPTNGWAKAYSGVNMDAFVKKITFQEITRDGLENISQSIIRLAEAEELIAHRNAVTVRMNSKIRNGLEN